MPVAQGKGYRTFAITGQKVLTSGSVPNLSSFFYNNNNSNSSTLLTQQKLQQYATTEQNDSFYEKSNSIRKNVQKFMSASATNLTILNDPSSFTTQHGSVPSGTFYNSRESGSLSATESSPPPVNSGKQNLEISIRVSTPDESNGKAPPNGRGRPNSPNITLIRGPKLSVFNFNDDFTFDEESSQAGLAENMLNDLTINSTLEQTSELIENDTDRSHINSSNSDGGYVSSEMSDNTLQFSPSVADTLDTQDLVKVSPDENNNNKDEARESFNDKNERLNGFQDQSETTLRASRSSRPDTLIMDDFGETTGEDVIKQQKSQRTMSVMSDDVFTETSTDETMRFSELRLSEASSMTFASSTLHNIDYDSNISYDIRINDSMGIPMVSTLRRQSGGQEKNTSVITNDPKNVNKNDQGEMEVIPLTVNGNNNKKEFSEPSPRKPDIPHNRNWDHERSSSFSGFSHLESLKTGSRGNTSSVNNRSFRDLSRISREHSYVKRNDSFIKSIENVSPWKGSWTARNVTFDESANTCKTFSKREWNREAEEKKRKNVKDVNDQCSIIQYPQDQKQRQHLQQRPTTAYYARHSYNPPQFEPKQHYASLDTRKSNSNRHSYQEPNKVRIPQQSNLTRHLHNISAPALGEDVTHKYLTLPRTSSTQNIVQNSNNVQHQSFQYYDHNYNKQSSAYVAKDSTIHTSRNVPLRQNRSNVQRPKSTPYYGSDHNISRTFSNGTHYQYYSNQNISVYSNPTDSNSSVSSLSPSRNSTSPPSSTSPTVPNVTSYVQIPDNHQNKNYRNVRRKLQLTDFNDGDDDDGGFHEYQERKLGWKNDSDKQKRRNKKKDVMTEEIIPRHPALQTTQEPHRWVGSGFQELPVQLSADRGYLLWHHPKGTLDVMIYYGNTGEDFSCFIEHQLPGVDVFYVHPTGRKELILDGTRSDHDSPDSKRTKSLHWSFNFNRNKEIRSWGGQIVLRLEPLRYFPCQSFKLPYFLAL